MKDGSEACSVTEFFERCSVRKSSEPCSGSKGSELCCEREVHQVCTTAPRNVPSLGSARIFTFEFKVSYYILISFITLECKKNPRKFSQYSVRFSPAEYEYESRFSHHVQIFQNFMTKV